MKFKIVKDSQQVGSLSYIPAFLALYFFTITTAKILMAIPENINITAIIGVSFTALLIRLRQFDMIEYHSLDDYIDSQFIGEVARWKQ